MNTKIKRPNFFIVGAPKCGTSSLAAWLSEHPQVFMSDPKEPNHFDTDLVNTWTKYDHPFKDRKKYERLFKSAKPQHRAVGEASVRYLYSADALSNILEYDPEARIVAMVRNPVEMAASLHGECLLGGTEDVVDFESAWALQAERANGLCVPRFCRAPHALQYGRFCCIGRQVKRMFDAVPPAQRHVIVLEDMKANPRKEWAAVLRFLQVSNDERTQFPVHNAAQRTRSTAVRAAVKNLSRAKQAIGLPRFRLGLLRKVDAFNRREQFNNPISPKFRTDLQEYFQDDVKLLGEVLERDFSGWLSAGGGLREFRPTGSEKS